ncbi:unnamed protein product, partial [Medioppia subpectinata]
MSRDNMNNDVLMATQTLINEYRQLTSHPTAYGSVARTDNILVWTLYMYGPERSQYEGGTFLVELAFPNTYPNRPPQVTFKTKIFHANIRSDGYVCTSLLSAWRSTDSVKTIMLALNNMMSQPNRDSPYTGQGLTDQEYNEKAREYTQQYAMKNISCNSNISILERLHVL